MLVRSDLRGEPNRSPLLGTRFEWRRRGDDEDDVVKTMQIEEIVPPDSRVSSDDNFVWNRLAHAERDTARRRFTHLDGKVQLYDKARYGPSAWAPRAGPGDSVCARKLWRVDGEISDETFATLVGLFYRGNDLIEEDFRAALAWPVVDAVSGSIPAAPASDDACLYARRRARRSRFAWGQTPG